MARHDCIECQEGKHGAFNGTAYVDFGDDLPLAEEECDCADRSHRPAIPAVVPSLDDLVSEASARMAAHVERGILGQPRHDSRQDDTPTQ
ncbi:MAG: hypothetical protein K0S37_3009 [Microbacterium sp.]|jgi:hypothetical protein|nr:hypothetical protein [Microbacterium sp.]